jgi:hypothetical protein
LIEFDSDFAAFIALLRETGRGKGIEKGREKGINGREERGREE